jgi:hypothetical protein
MLRKQGLTHFSAYWVRCKGRPAYITVNESLTLNDNWVAQGNTSTGVARYWREWIKRYPEKIAEFSKDWAEMSAEESRTFWEGQDEEEQPAKTYVLAGLATLKAQFDDIRVDFTDFD